MAYRCGEREQMVLLPACIEDYVSKEDPVRVYDAFVESLDLSSLGIEYNPNKVGNSEYEPGAMLKSLVYGYSYGVRSSRKLERALHHNLSFMWLVGGLKPDHKTIAEFRRKNKKSLKQVLRQCAQMCIALELIDGNVLFVDGTKVRANAGRGRTYKRKHYEKLLRGLEEQIENLLKQCEAQDMEEEGSGSLVSMGEELSEKGRLKTHVEEALKEMDARGSDSLNETDEDCRLMSSVQGSHASYNVQGVVDDENGLVVHAEVVSDTSDVNQFAQQVDGAQEVLGKRCKSACADSGYADTEELEKVDAQGVHVVVPSQRQALKQGEKPFSKSVFRYDREQDCYWCPAGKKLKYKWTEHETGKRWYQVKSGGVCSSCAHFGECTKSKRGRKVTRLALEEVKERLEAQYETAESQAIYTRRKMRSEHPFGHIKRNLGVDGFLLRGLHGVQAETSLLFTCFNLARMKTILGGVRPLVDALEALRVPAQV